MPAIGTISLEAAEDGSLALRLGFRQVDGFREEWADQIAAKARTAPFASVEELARRAVCRRARCACSPMPMRAARWGSTGAPRSGMRAACGKACCRCSARPKRDELGEEADAHLPATPLVEHVLTDYQTTRLSLKGHPMAFLRRDFEREGVLSARRDRRHTQRPIVPAAGVVLIRQRPGKGNAIFVTLEDEGGVVNILLWARISNAIAARSWRRG
jgi:error-prone DNA polymerase